MLILKIKIMTKKEAKKIKIQILKPIAGKFGLPDNIGDKISIDEKQATEMIDMGYAKKL